MKTRTTMIVIILSLLISWGLSSSQSFGVEAEPFYKNKTVRIIVGLSAGGGYDRAARLVSRYGPIHPWKPHDVGAEHDRR